MRTGQRKWDKSTAHRRPVHYWATLNNWWRGYLEEKGRRPSSTEVQVWYNEHADAVWGSSKPTWKEARVHAKCLRSTEQVKNYFRRYRRARGSANASRGAAVARQAPEEAPGGEDAGEDNDVASLIALHNASLIGGGRTIHTDSPGSSAADALPLPSLSQRNESNALVHVKQEEQGIHQLGREAPVLGMLNPATVTTGDSPTPPWITRMPSGRSSRFRPNQSPADGRQSPGRTPFQEMPPRPARSLLRHSNSVGPLTSSTCDAAAAAWHSMTSPAATSLAWQVSGSTTQRSTMDAGYPSPDMLPASTLTATHSLPAALTSSLSIGMGIHSYAYQGEAVAMAVDTPRPLTPLYRATTAHETQTGHTLDMYTRRVPTYWDCEAELHNTKPRMVSAASAALPEGSTSTGVAANSMEWQAGAPPQGSRPEPSRSAAPAAAAAPTTGSTTPRPGPLPTTDSGTDLAELLAGLREDPDASADPHTNPRQLHQAQDQPGLAKPSRLLDVPRSASFPYGSHPRSKGMTTMTSVQHEAELHMASGMSVQAWSHQQPHLAKTKSVPNSPRPVLPYDLQSDFLSGWRGALVTSGGGAPVRAGSSGNAARPSFLELLESQACKHEEEEEEEEEDEQGWQEPHKKQHQPHYLHQQPQHQQGHQQQQQLYEIQYVQQHTATPVSMGYAQPWLSHGTSRRAGDHAVPMRSHVREPPQDVQRLWQEGETQQQEQQYYAQEQQQRQAQGQQHGRQWQQEGDQQQHGHQWQQQQQQQQQDGDQQQEGSQQQGQDWDQQHEQCHELQMHSEQHEWVAEQQPCQQPHWGLESQGVLEEQQQQQGDAQCERQQQQQEQLIEHPGWVQQYQGVQQQLYQQDWHPDHCQE